MGGRKSGVTLGRLGQRQEGRRRRDEEVLLLGGTLQMGCTRGSWPLRRRMAFSATGPGEIADGQPGRWVLDSRQAIEPCIPGYRTFSGS